MLIIRRTFPRAAFVAALLALASAPLHAQDEAEPWMTFDPGEAIFTSPSLSVTVRFLDNASLNTGTRRIIFNGDTVTNLFTHSGMGAEFGYVVTTSSGTVTLQPGPNTLEARICDNAGNCSNPQSVTYTYAAGRPQVSVSPDGGTANGTAGSASAHVFRVVNRGTAAGTYTLRTECRDAWTGARLAGCTVPNSTISVPANDSVSVTVTAPAGTAGATQLVRLSAELGGMPGVADAGWVDVSVAGNAGATMPVMQFKQVDLATGTYGVQRGNCVTVAVAPGAAYECGDLRMTHPLPPHRTLNRAWAPTLIYNSQHAEPNPTAYFDITLPVGMEVPYLVQPVLYSPVTGQVAPYFAGADWKPGTTRRVAVPLDARETGWHMFYVQVLAITSDYRQSTTAVGSTGYAVVNRGGSPFGQGWWLAGLERLVCIDCGQGGHTLLWIGGDGSTRRYAPLPGGTAWESVYPGAAPDTLTFTGSNYVRRLFGGGRVEFDAAGQHVRTVTRLGEVTTFEWQGGRLERMLVPTAAGATPPAYHFAYDANGVLATVTATAPGAPSRTVTLGHELGDRRVTYIQDPDGVRVRFGYGAGRPGLVTQHTDRRGTPVVLTWSANGRLTSSRLGLATGDSIIRGFEAVEDKGYGASVPVAQAYTALDGPRTDVADHTLIWPDDRGAVRRVRDAAGGETLLARGDSRFPGLVTEVRGPNGRGDSLVVKSTAVYDARGRVSRSRVQNPLGNGAHLDRWYRYDDRWNLPDTITAVGEGTIVIAYDSINGNKLWQQQGGSSRRVSFGYYPSGQLARVIYPENAQGVVARDTMGYDAVGNLSWTRTPLGYLTQHYRDALGRDTLVLSPIRADSSSTLAQLQVAGLRSRTIYDAAERVWMTEAIGPETRIQWQGITASTKLSRVEAQSVTTRTTYDDGGLPLKVERWTMPDTADLNIVTTEYEYDRAGRKTGEREGMDAWEYYGHDPAGNVVTWTTGRGFEITTEYDALGRQVRRSVPAVSYPAFPQPCWATGFNDCPFPHFPNSGSGYVVPGDTALFAYDAAGQLVYAANADAVVTRTYYPGGALRTDTLRIRTFGAGDFNQHVYGLAYRYDAQGRPRAVEHPANLAGSAAQVDSFTYSPATGVLERVFSRAGPRFSFRYDRLGRVVQDSFPGGENTYVYDLDGRRRLRGGTAYQDSIRYDARGKPVVSWVNILSQTSTFYNHYSGLGNLVATDWTNQFNGARNLQEMVVDGLGNVRWKRTANDQSALAPEHWTVYDPGSTRVKEILFSMPSDALDPHQYTPDNTHRTYDAAGNVYLGSTVAGGPGKGEAYTRTYTMSFYSADERLRAYQHNHEINPTRQNGHGKRGYFAEYFYDALGRRIQVRTRREGLCYAGPYASTVDCTSGIERFVWAGDNILWEMRGPGGNSDPSWLLNRVSDGGEEFGTVGYTHAGGVDRPLVVWKGDPSNPGAVVVPHLNWRGLFGKGTDPSGYATTAPIEWPGFQTTANHSRAPTQMPTKAWFGSLLEGQRDAGGQMYMRNRYYDPATGQFTQTDPIGLGGGLNTYGFANGDAVSYSDPYGLCAKDAKGVEDSTCRAIINFLRTVGREAQVPRGQQNLFNAAANVYERTSRRVEVVGPLHPRLNSHNQNGDNDPATFANGRTMDGVYLLNSHVLTGDFAAAAAHEALVHEGENGAYEGDILPSTKTTNWNIWQQLPARLQPLAPNWKGKVGAKDPEPLIDVWPR